MALSNTTVATADSGGSRGTHVELVYDPKTGNWVPIAFANKSDTSSTSPEPPKSSSGSSPSSDAPAPNVDSKKDAEKEYIEAEFNVLTGELSVTPTKKSIRIKVNDTVRIEGLGKYLSGLYFVSAVSRTINKDSGYSHSFQLMKNGFGDSVKKAKEEETTTEELARNPEVEKTAPELKSGDSVKIVGDDAVYSNAHDGVKVPAWVKKKTLTISQVSGDKTRVLLQPINSWTYVKYVQKV